MTTEYDLMSTFAFDEQDLAANRRCRFSAKQRNQLVKANLQGVPLFTLIALLLAGVSSLALHLTPAEGVLLFLVFAIGLLALWVSYTGIQLLFVHRCQGTITLSPDPYRLGKNIPTMVSDWQGFPTGDYFQIGIGQESFYVSSGAYQALKRYDGRECIVYFILWNKGRSRQILSLEIR